MILFSYATGIYIFVSIRHTHATCPFKRDNCTFNRFFRRLINNGQLVHKCLTSSDNVMLDIHVILGLS